MTDFATKKSRLTKKKVSDHFKPELDDDTFGFQELSKTTWSESFITIIGLVVLWGVLVLWFSF